MDERLGAVTSVFAITAEASTVSLDANRHGAASFTVTNTTAIVLRGRARIVAQPAAAAPWLSLAGDAVRGFLPGTMQQYSVQITVPADEPPGTYAFRLDLDAVGVANPDEQYTQGPSVAFTVAAPPPPITVVLSALSLASMALNPVSDQAIKDGYARLKALIIRKFGDKSPELQPTLAQYEQEPEVWKESVKNTLQSVGADKDQEVLDYALELLRWAETVQPGITGGLVVHINAQGGRVVVIGRDTSGSLYNLDDAASGRFFEKFFEKVVHADASLRAGHARVGARRHQPGVTADPHLRLPPHRTVGWPLFVRRLRWPWARRPDPVECSVFAPPRARRRTWVLLQVWAHRPEQAKVAAEQAKEFDEQSSRRGFTNLGVEVSRGARLTFQVRLPGLVLREKVESFVWHGRPATAQFAAYVRPNQPLGDVVGTVLVAVDGVPAGHVKFKLAIIEHARGSEPEPRAQPLGDGACRYQLAFISYASPDRAEVLKRVQMLARLRIEYFQDLLSLEPGVRWERELYRHIDRSDLFLLFWSTAARESEWVRKEILYALQRKQSDDFAPPEIVPVPIEGPPPVPPPEELAHLHFNDSLLYVMAGENAQVGTKSSARQRPARRGGRAQP